MPVALAIVALAVGVVGAFYVRKLRRISDMPPIPPVIPPQGFDVPILAAFSGLKGLPHQASFTHNNANPSLTLFEDRIECRVLANRSIPLSAIESVGIWDSVATRNLNVYVRDRQDVFTANLLSRRNLAEVA